MDGLEIVLVHVNFVQSHANVNLLFLRGLQRRVKQTECPVRHVSQLIWVDGLMLNLNDQLVKAEADLGSGLSHEASVSLITWRHAVANTSQT